MRPRRFSDTLFRLLIVHHLGKSQSERIVWLCEEFGIPYALKVYDRHPVTRLAQADCKALLPLGATPMITDGDVVLIESAAIVDHVVAKYHPAEASGRRVLAADRWGGT
ncbi:MAG: glutathione S-transferase N-terminal domain-containing protein [Reyranella sp.]|nr:glutathione S-transferase N-terminal domain-containing protein [Reyranella sp.]